MRTFQMPWKRDRYKDEANKGTGRKKPVGGIAHLYNAVAQTSSSDVRRTSVETQAVRGGVISRIKQRGRSLKG